MKEKETNEPQGEALAEADSPNPDILEEIEVEDFAVDGICGVY